MSLATIKMEETKQIIIKEALHMFYWNGIIDTTISDIAQKCRVGTTSVYRYFGTKSGLVAKTSELMWEKMKIAIAEEEEKNSYNKKTGLEQVEFYMNLYFKIYKNRTHYFYYLYEFNKFIGLQDITIEEYEILTASRCYIKNYITDAIAKGKKDGSIRYDVNPDDVASLNSSFVSGLSQKIALFEKGEITNESTIQDIEACKKIVLFYLKG